MTYRKPLVSIGMPVYNGDKSIREALDSLLAQDYENFELIISDNVSTDRTAEICQEYLAKDKRIRYYLNETNLGAVRNFNRVFELSTGKYFAWAAHDDLWDPTYIRKCVRVLEGNPSVVLCCTSLTFIDEDGRLRDIEYEGYDNPDLSSPDIHERVRILILRDGWFAIYGLIRADALKRTGLARKVYGWDVVLLMELCLLGAFAKVPEVLFYYRVSHDRTEEDRAIACQVKRSDSQLIRELVHTVLVSSLDPFIKTKVALEIVSTVYIRSSTWRYRLGVPSFRSLRARVPVRTRLRRALQLIADVRIERVLRKQKQSLRCALIEYGDYHGETLPALVYVLNALGISVDVYVSRRVRQSNPFIYSSGLGHTLRETEGIFFKGWVERRQFRDYDFIVLNSLEPKGILRQVAGIPIPIVALIHNVSLIKSDSNYARFFAAPARSPLVLAQHISSFLSDTLTAQWVWPLHPLDIGRVKTKSQMEVCFWVQDSLRPERGNYDSLIDGIEQLTSGGIGNFRVVVVFGNNTKDRLMFEEQVRIRKLSSYFTLRKGESLYKDYCDSIASLHFVLMPFDTAESECLPYFLEKVTTFVCVAFSLGVVPIIHKQIARMYGIEGLSVTYEDGRLCDALKQALSVDQGLLERIPGDLVSKREALLSESLMNMGETLRELGLTSKINRATEFSKW